MASTLSLVRTKSGREVHLGYAGTSTVVGHQFPSSRSVTRVDYYAKDVTCDRCKESPLYTAWKQEQN